MFWIKRLVGGPRTKATSEVPSPFSDANTELVVKLAKVFLSHVRQKAPDFDRAFYRAVIEPQQHGGRASYVIGEQVTLMDAVQERALFKDLQAISWEIVDLMGKNRGVLLLVVSKTFDYEIKFE